MRLKYLVIEFLIQTQRNHSFSIYFGFDLFFERQLVSFLLMNRKFGNPVSRGFSTLVTGDALVRGRPRFRLPTSASWNTFNDILLAHSIQKNREQFSATTQLVYRIIDKAKTMKVKISNSHPFYWGRSHQEISCSKFRAALTLQNILTK